MLSSVIAPWMQCQHPEAIAKAVDARLEKLGAKLEKLSTRFCQIEL